MSIRLENVYFTYSPGSVYEKHAIKDICLTINDGEFVGLIGHTGSGKSTLIQHLNALMQPTSGKIYFNDEDIWRDGYNRRNLRFHVGLVFQYPEHQLFESDVITDVCFGPKNQGLSVEEATDRAIQALRQTGLPEEAFQKSPFDLSGGEKRRAAIAGVLAMKPEILILDEPTAGLDPMGKQQILNLLRELHRTEHTTILMVTHNMDEAAEYADRMIVMDEGRVILDGDPHEVFENVQTLQETGLSIPQAAQICRDLGIQNCITMEEAAQAIIRKYRPA